MPACGAGSAAGLRGPRCPPPRGGHPRSEPGSRRLLPAVTLPVATRGHQIPTFSLPSTASIPSLGLGAGKNRKGSGGIAAGLGRGAQPRGAWWDLAGVVQVCKHTTASPSPPFLSSLCIFSSRGVWRPVIMQQYQRAEPTLDISDQKPLPAEQML